VLEAYGVDLRAGDLRRVHQPGVSLHLGRAVAAQGNVSVEVLLPKSRGRLSLACSGRSAVLGVDADGGTPDGDFTDEGDARVAA
jgi:hypothetical protein